LWGRIVGVDPRELLGGKRGTNLARPSDETRGKKLKLKIWRREK